MMYKRFYFFVLIVLFFFYFSSVDAQSASISSEVSIGNVSNDSGGDDTDGGSSGAGGGGSSGAGGGSQIFVPDFSIDEDLISVKIKQGETKDQFLVITNEDNIVLNFVVELKGLEDFVSIAESSFSLDPGKSKSIILSFFVDEDAEINIHTGNILVKTFGVEKKVSVVLEIVEKSSLFDLEIRLLFDVLSKSEKLDSVIRITDVAGRGEVSVLLEYFIKDFDDFEIKLTEETIEVDGILEIERKFSIPDILDVGEYVFYVKLTQEDNVVVSSQSFILKEKIFFYRYIILFLVFLILLFLVLFFLFKKHKRRKKRK